MEAQCVLFKSWSLFSLQVMLYPGHEEGAREAAMVKAWAQKLVGRIAGVRVMQHEPYSRNQKAPILLMISNTCVAVPSTDIMK